MHQSLCKDADVFRVIGVEGLEEAGGGLFVVLPVFGGLLPGFEEGVAAFFGGELGIVDSHADFLEEIRIVNERVAPVKRVVVEVILLVFPLVAGDRIEGEIRHTIAEDIARLISSLTVAGQIQIRSELIKGRILSHVKRIHHHHGRNTICICTIGMLADEHRDRAVFGHRDIRLKDADSPSTGLLPAPKWIKSKTRGGFRALVRVSLEKHRAPNVRHRHHRTPCQRL